MVRVADTWRRLVLAHLAGLGIVPADGGSGSATPGTWWRQEWPADPVARVKAVETRLDAIGVRPTWEDPPEYEPEDG